MKDLTVRLIAEIITDLTNPLSKLIALSLVLEN
jgi:hypothetical protein